MTQWKSELLIWINKKQFPHAHARKIMTEFKEWIPSICGSLKSGFERHDPERTGYVSYNDFRDVIYENMPKEIECHYPEHATKTVARYYADDKYIGLCFRDLISRVQSELYRKKFYDFEDLKVAFGMHDDEKTSHLDPERIYYVMRTASLPLSRDLLKSFIYKFPKKENKINYNDLIETINWVENPTEYDKAEPHLIQINWERNEKEKDLEKIKYNCFLVDLVTT